MLYYSYTLMFSLVLQHCCYGVVCRFVRSLMAFDCQEIRVLLTYLLTCLLSVVTRPLTHLFRVALYLFT